MCEVNIYLLKDGKEELILKEANIVRSEKDGLFLRSIFGEQKTIKARIIEINMTNHKVILEKI